MTTPTETGLLSYAKIDGLTFIVDAEGRTLGQVVPEEITDQMIEALPSVVDPDVTNDYRAMLSAATVDLTGAVVKVESDSDDDIASLR